MKSKDTSQSNNISLKSMIILILILCLFSLGIIAWSYAFYGVVFNKVYEINIETVSEKTVGFNTDPTLDFGKLPSSGGMSKKELKIRNDFEFPVKVKINVIGPAKDFVIVENSDFILNSNESRKLMIYANIPNNFGRSENITGIAKITYIRTR